MMSVLKTPTDSHEGEAPTHEWQFLRITPEDQAVGERLLANEVPTAMEFDGTPYAVMMLSPTDLEDFALGFAHSERIVSSPHDIARIDVRHGTKGIGIDVRLEEEHSHRLIERRRAIAGASGCGICGLTTIEEALPELEPIVGCPQVSAAAIFSALDALPAHQNLNGQTGAVHAAAFCRPNGDIVAVREDVGRHNAFDKLVGFLLREGLDTAAGFALLSSRCSFELVQKAVLARIPFLVTISAPTELAVKIAKESKLTLVALARRDSVLLFNNPYQSLIKAM
jgi:FdhD protein